MTAGPRHAPQSPPGSELDRLFVSAYEELRRLAAAVRGRGATTTITPTALVNEAWLKLSASADLRPTSRLHFKRIAARAMRQVLVEAARRRHAAKRGGGALLVTFDEALEDSGGTPEEVLALEESLEALARLAPRQAQVVECRFYGGLEVAETAELLGISEATVLRDWRAARAWLLSQLRPEG